MESCELLGLSMDVKAKEEILRGMDEDNPTSVGLVVGQVHDGLMDSAVRQQVAYTQAPSGTDGCVGALQWSWRV